MTSDRRTIVRSAPVTARRRVLGLALPTLVELLAFPLFSAADLAMVAHLGAGPVTVVGLSMQPMFLLAALFLAGTVGGTAMVARHVGRGDRAAARAVARRVMALTAVVGAVVAGGANLAAPAILRFMGLPAGLMAQGVPYLRLLAVSMLFMGMANTAAAMFRAAGDTRTPMVVNITTGAVQVVMDVLLIFPHGSFAGLGVLGEGGALLLARALATAWFLWVLARPNGQHSSVRVSLPELGRLGWPATAEGLFMSAGLTQFAREVAVLGTGLFAAHQIALNLVAFAFLPGQAYGLAAGALAGQALGAGNHDEAGQDLAAGMRLAQLTCGGIGLILVAGGGWFARLYTTDPATLALVAAALRVGGLMEFFQGTNLALTSGLRSIGDTRWPLMGTAVGVWLVRVPLGLVLPGMLGITGVWLSIAADHVTRAAVAYWRVRSGAWRRVEVGCAPATAATS